MRWSRKVKEVGCALLFGLSACGGPTVPSVWPTSSPAAPDAENAPLPTLGSSFEEAPLSEEEMHGGHSHHGHDSHRHEGHGHAH